MRNNIVIFLSDEETNERPYESDALKMWRKNNLPISTFFDEHGISSDSHHINNSGCRPSRADIQTGVSHKKHKVTSTEGLAKDEDEILAIDPEKTPTLGNYLTASGYNCYYKGKSHFGVEEIDLKKYGYKDWKPPEGHGTVNMHDGTGYFRDEKYTQEVLDLIPHLKEPYCLYVSLLNPHDITFLTAFNLRNYWWGNLFLKYLKAPDYEMVIDETVPYCGNWDTLKHIEGKWKYCLLEDTYSDDFSCYGTNVSCEYLKKPSVHKEFSNIYKKMITSETIHDILHSDVNKIRRFYFTLIKNVQQHFLTIFTALQKHPSYDRTFFIYTSDHGEMNGRHDLYQKWHNAFEETTNVPFKIFHPTLQLQKMPKNTLTCHFDILPTILGLTNTGIPKGLMGKNLAPYILGTRGFRRENSSFESVGNSPSPCNEVSPLSQDDTEVSPLSPCERGWSPLQNRRITFETLDDITHGNYPWPLLIKRLPVLYALGLQKYTGLAGARFIHTEIKSVPGEGIYKYSIYYNPDDTSDNIEEELYEITNDPLEKFNLIYKHQEIKNKYFKRLSNKYRNIRKKGKR